MPNNSTEALRKRPAPGEISLLFAGYRKGDAEAAERLLPLVYIELRRLAAGFMRRERAGHTLQPTALVHEAYLRLIKPQNANWKDRAHFFGIAARTMRQILVEYAREHNAAKRGGGQPNLPLDEARVFASGRPTDFWALDEALVALAQLDARQCQIVELRYFTGLSVEETAEVLGVSLSTVKQEWALARVWLHRWISRLESSETDGRRTTPAKL